MSKTIRLTMAQAVTRFLSRQMTEIDGKKVPIFGGVWAIFVAWAGTFAAGGPKPEVLRKIWPTMLLGNVTACLIVVMFGVASQNLSGTALTLAQCAILFCMNGSMMALGRF